MGMFCKGKNTPVSYCYMSNQQCALMHSELDERKDELEDLRGLVARFTETGSKTVHREVQEALEAFSTKVDEQKSSLRRDITDLLAHWLEQAFSENPDIDSYSYIEVGQDLRAKLADLGTSVTVSYIPGVLHEAGEISISSLN